MATQELWQGRLRATQGQFATLIDFMERHSDLSRAGLGPVARIKGENLWLELAKTLNKTPGGVQKSVDKWKRVWADWKCKTKKKAIFIRRRTAQGLKCLALTSFETRVMEVIKANAKQSGPKEQDVGVSLSPLTYKSSSPAEETADPNTNPVEMTIKNDPLEEVFLDENSLNINPESPESEEAPPSPPAAPSPSEDPPPSITNRRRRRRAIPYERIPYNYLALEYRRLRFEEASDRRLHEREMEKLQLERRRIEMEREHSELIKNLLPIAEKITQFIQQCLTKNVKVDK